MPSATLSLHLFRHPHRQLHQQITSAQMAYFQDCISIPSAFQSTAEVWLELTQRLPCCRAPTQRRG